jgi:hypothetical protein
MLASSIFVAQRMENRYGAALKSRRRRNTNMKYSVVRRIGHGGFGVVEEVTDSAGVHLARKTFRPAAHIPPDAYDGLKKRFKREVKIQRELGGQEIMPVIDADLDASAPWFVMPLADKTYEAQIADDRRTGSVDVDAVADILNGLQYLHDLDYVHRDLNPKNILRHGEHWKLTDLGAVLPPSGMTITLTEDTLIYTEKYCSPEQRRDFHTVQTPADVYSFGCILHDIFVNSPRRPYAQHSAPGAIGVIIEKCTELNPDKRPTVKVLRPMLLETLIEIGGHCKVEDHEAESWLKRLESVADWTEDDYGEFARFFAHLDTTERSSGHEVGWVYSLSTPFLTRVPAEALAKIVARKDGLASAIVEKYCDWVCNTSFLFHYADTVSSRLEAIFDAGTPTNKAHALIAMIELGESHNRWYVMRTMLRCCGKDRISKEEGRRLAIEIRTEEMERQLKRCIEVTGWDKAVMAADIAKLCV